MFTSYRVETRPNPGDLYALRRGLNSHNLEFGCSPLVEMAIFLRDDNGDVRGGVFGELGWGWLYIDLVWVDEVLRGQGIGSRLIESIEQAALKRGMEYSYLGTTSFQARPFYERLGYQQFGMLEDRPHGHEYYYLWRRIPALADISGELFPVERPNVDDFFALKRGLSAHNLSQGIGADGRRLAIFARDEEDGTVLGGIAGATYWGWFDLQDFWVDETRRDEGYGSYLLELAEQEAVARGYPHVVVDITQFQSLEFFLHRGFSVFGTLENRPSGYATYFLRKDLSDPR